MYFSTYLLYDIVHIPALIILFTVHKLKINIQVYSLRLITKRHIVSLEKKNQFKKYAKK